MPVTYRSIIEYEIQWYEISQNINFSNLHELGLSSTYKLVNSESIILVNFPQNYMKMRKN